MVTFLFGILILILGYLFYSRYVESQFQPNNEKTPANSINDGVDFVPMSQNRNSLIHFLNIAGMGPILGAIQGVLFGPVAFILIPLGCILAGGVHDYFAGMLSIKNNGAQITGLIEKYLGKNAFKFFVIVVLIMLLLLAAVFVYTSGDLFAERFFGIKDFSIQNPVMICIYLSIIFYFIVATLFPIDKIIGRFYPILGLALIIGTGLILVSFALKGVNLENLNFSNVIKYHPDGLPILPMFFMTVSCGLLSGFHSTQATIISRTVKHQKEGRRIFYGMMCLESLIAMIWAAAAMDIYSLSAAGELSMEGVINPRALSSTAVINLIADKFVPLNLAFLVTLAVIVLPITSGDTALRGLRITIADVLKLEQKSVKNRLFVSIPILVCVLLVLYWAKVNGNSFSLIWRYFTFFNQLIAIPVLFCATIFLIRQKRNFLIAFIPGLFYVFITMSFILSEKIGFNIPLQNAQIIALILALLSAIWVLKLGKKPE